MPHKKSGFVTKKNVREANDFYKTVYSKDDILLVTGSFFLVSDFLKLKDYKNIFSQDNFSRKKQHQNIVR